LIDQKRVIVLHHTDIAYSNNYVQHVPSLMDGLQRFFSVSVQLLPPPQTELSSMAQLTGFNPVEQFSYMNTMSNNTTAMAKIMWKRKSGKILHETNAVRFDGQRVVVSAAIVQDEEENEAEPEAPAGADPTANLSFNLTLTDEQRRAKEKLVLPYMKAQNRGVVEVDSGERSGNVEPTSTGSIYYEPDAADDFDDEDPDEDLDI
jgi:elongator complex protein 5